jgi:homoserine kinase
LLESASSVISSCIRTYPLDAVNNAMDDGAIERIRDDFRVMTMQIRNTALRQWAPSAALVGATATWGSTFVVTKDANDKMSVLGFLTWRFGIAAADGRSHPGRGQSAMR